MSGGTIFVSSAQIATKTGRNREALVEVATSALAWVAALDYRKPDEWWLHGYEVTLVPSSPAPGNPFPAG